MIDYKTPSDLLAAGYVLHHTATHPGYHTRKNVTTEPYEGRFGTGFRVHKAHPSSTQFHIVEYWIKEADEVEPVRHGRWIPIEYDSYADGAPAWDKYECSECSHEHNGEEDTLTAFCPDCGARMDGKERTKK